MIRNGPQKAQTVRIEDAARALGISRASAYRAARRGELPGSFRIGGRVLVRKAVLERFLLNEAPPNLQAERPNDGA